MSFSCCRTPVLKFKKWGTIRFDIWRWRYSVGSLWLCSCSCMFQTTNSAQRYRYRWNMDVRVHLGQQYTSSAIFNPIHHFDDVYVIMFFYFELFIILQWGNCSSVVWQSAGNSDKLMYHRMHQRVGGPVRHMGLMKVLTPNTTSPQKDL